MNAALLTDPLTECGLCHESFQGSLKDGEAWFVAHRNQEHPEAVPAANPYRRHLSVVRDDQRPEREEYR